MMGIIDEWYLLLGADADCHCHSSMLTRKLIVDDYLVIYGKLEDLAEHFGG